jgi:hypothetical protein
MNTYKPLHLITVDKNGEKSSVVIREYALYNIDVSKMMLSGEYKSVIVEEIPAYHLYMWDGFYLEHDGSRFVAHDLRVNEGMHFSGETQRIVYNQIENCLHELALEEEKERVRKATQLAREKARNERS